MALLVLASAPKDMLIFRKNAVNWGARSCSWARSSPSTNNRLSRERIEGSPEEKALGVLVDEELSMSLPCVLGAQKARRIPDGIQSSVANRSMGMDLPLCSAVWDPHLDCCIQLWCLQYKDRDLLEWIQSRATNNIRGLEPSPVKTGWESWGGSGQDKAPGDFIAPFRDRKSVV